MKQITKENAYTINDAKLEHFAHIALDNGFDFVHLDDVVNALYLHNAGSVVEVRIAPYGDNVDCTVIVREMDHAIKHNSSYLGDESCYDEVSKELDMINTMDNQGWFDVMHIFADTVSSNALRKYKNKQEDKLRDISYSLQELSEML